jgi:hypothetical protein
VDGEGDGIEGVEKFRDSFGGFVLQIGANGLGGGDVDVDIDDAVGFDLQGRGFGLQAAGFRGGFVLHNGFLGREGRKGLRARAGARGSQGGFVLHNGVVGVLGGIVDVDVDVTMGLEFSDQGVEAASEAELEVPEFD